MELRKLFESEKDFDVYYDEKTHEFRVKTEGGWEKLSGKEYTDIYKEFMKQEYDRQAKDRNPEYDPKKMKKAAFDSVDVGETGDLSKFKGKLVNKKSRRTNRKADTLQVSPTPAEIVDQIVKTIFPDTPTRPTVKNPWTWQPTYEVQNTDDVLFDKSGQVDKIMPGEDIDIDYNQWEEDPNEREEGEPETKPHILFYFDRSGSFQGRKGSLQHAKTVFGDHIVAEFMNRAAGKEITISVRYFASSVGTSENQGSGNDDYHLYLDIKDQTWDNTNTFLVFFTDSDQSISYPLHIGGKVWFIFADSANLDFPKKMTGSLGAKLYYINSKDLEPYKNLNRIKLDL